MIMFLNGFKALCKMGLTGLQWNILSTMICSADHNNVIKLKQKHIADELDIAPARVSEAVRVFKEKGIIVEDNDPLYGKFYIFNPQLGHMSKDFRKTERKFKTLKVGQKLSRRHSVGAFKVN